MAGGRPCAKPKKVVLIMGGFHSKKRQAESLGRLPIEVIPRIFGFCSIYEIVPFMYISNLFQKCVLFSYKGRKIRDYEVKWLVERNAPEEFLLLLSRDGDFSECTKKWKESLFLYCLKENYSSFLKTLLSSVDPTDEILNQSVRYGRVELVKFFLGTVIISIAFLLTFCFVRESKEIVVEKLLRTDERSSRRHDMIFEDEEEAEEGEESGNGEFSTLNDEQPQQQPEEEEERNNNNNNNNNTTCCWRCLTYLPWTIPMLYLMRFVLYTTYATKVMYFGVFCGRVVFNGDPEGTDDQRKAFEDGVRWAGLIIFIHLIFCTLMVPFLGILQRFRVRVIWGIAEILDIIGFIIIFFVRDKWLLLIFYNVFFFLHEITVTYYPNVMFNMIVKSDPRLKNRKGVINAFYSTSNVFPKVGLALLGGLIVDSVYWLGLGMGGMMIFAALWCVCGLIIMLILPVNEIFALG